MTCMNPCIILFKRDTDRRGVNGTHQIYCKLCENGLNAFLKKFVCYYSSMYKCGLFFAIFLHRLPPTT